MNEPAIGLPQQVSNASTALIADIVFVRRDAKGKELFAFQLGTVTSASTVQWHESIQANPTGGNAGTGIFKIDGDVECYQNDALTLNELQRHLGRLFEIHILYSDGKAVSSKALSVAGNIEELKTRFQFTVDRFNNIEALRSQMGVVLELDDNSGGGYESIHLIISGSSAEKCNWIPAGIADFYNRFLTLKSSLPTSKTGTNG